MNTAGIRRLFAAGVLGALLVAGLAAGNVLIQPLWRAVVVCSSGQAHMVSAYLVPALCVVLVASGTHLLARRYQTLAQFGRPLCMSGMLCTSFIVGSFSMALEPMGALYVRAGVSLSVLTSLAMLPGKLYWLVPLGCLAFWVAGMLAHLRSRWFGWLWCVLAVMMLVIQTALYAPIFNFGCLNGGI